MEPPPAHLPNALTAPPPHITKIERYVELLLLAGVNGLTSIEVARTLPTSSASSYMNTLRKHLSVASVPNHAFIDARQAVDALAYLDTLRAKRGVQPYSALVLKGWFK